MNFQFSSVQDGIYALRNVNKLCSAPAPDSLRYTHKRCLAFETVPTLVLFPKARNRNVKAETGNVELLAVAKHAI